MTTPATDSTVPTKRSRKTSGFLAIFASIPLAVIVLLFLLLITFFGTLEQTRHGLYVVQSRYFESLYVIHPLFGRFPLPLPGGYLLMTLLFINLLLGGIIRARRSWRQPGLIIVHFGILFLLVGAFVTDKMADEGSMALFETEQANVFSSYHEWEVTITDTSAALDNEHIIPHQWLADLSDNGTRTFHATALPFELTISHYHRNAQPRHKNSVAGPPQPLVDDFFLQPLTPDPEASQNVPGCYVRLTDPTTGAEYDAILWGGAMRPWVVNVDGRRWAFNLGRKYWPLPFTVKLDNFTRELYPGTTIPKVFRSTITKSEGGATEAVEISMNEPLRHRGYTLFQASWGEAETARGPQLYSVFAVVRNPADQWPLYSCIIVSFGMLLHFGQRLFAFLSRRSGSRA